MLKTLMLRKKLEGYNARMAELNQRTAELATREGELETAMNEAKTEEELRSVEELVTAFTEEQRSHQETVSALQAEIDAATEELRSLESQTPPLTSGDGEPEKTHSREERTVLTRIQTRAFGSMTAEQRSAFIAREDVKEFLTRFRNMFSGGQKRSVTGADLLIPTVVLNLLRENVEDYSKLLRRVRYIPVAGRSRMPIMGTFPEAVWTEACAALNELYFTINDVEVDGYKVGGYVTLCNATLEDTDGVLLFAKTRAAEAELLAAFKNRAFEKIYRAEVYGKFAEKEGILCDYLVKDAANARVKIHKTPVKGSVRVVTAYEVTEERENSSVLAVRLVTGRTHQIRAHLAFYGHFVIGDGKYGKESVNRAFGAKRQRLSAEKLVLHFHGGALAYLDGKTIERGN